MINNPGFKMCLSNSACATTARKEKEKKKEVRCGSDLRLPGERSADDAWE
jgi:hypothetical protein